MKHRNRLVMGSAFSLAALAVAIDHTRHELPAAQRATVIQEQDSTANPCALDTNPCAMGADNPCSLTNPVSPCSL